MTRFSILHNAGAGDGSLPCRVSISRKSREDEEARPSPQLFRVRQIELRLNLMFCKWAHLPIVSNSSAMTSRGHET
jgi:hypothetical protein